MPMVQTCCFSPLPTYFLCVMQTAQMDVLHLMMKQQVQLQKQILAPETGYCQVLEVNFYRNCLVWQRVKNNNAIRGRRH